MTIFLNYCQPKREVFVKPTTMKEIIGFWEIDNLFKKLSKRVTPALSPKFAGFTWFLNLVPNDGNANELN